MTYTFDNRPIVVTIDAEFEKKARQAAQSNVMAEKNIGFDDIAADPMLVHSLKGEVDAAVLAAALGDPVKSGITTADPELARVIEDMKDLVDTAKAINEEHAADIRVGAKAPGKYEIFFRGQLYAYDLTVKGVEKALDRIRQILIHYPNVVVERFKADPTATPLKAALDLQTFIACKMNRFLGIVTLDSCEGSFPAVVYTPKRKAGTAYRGDDAVVEDEDGGEW